MASRLPTLEASGPALQQAGQFDALNSGQAQGGNFQQFKDAASQGFVSNDKDGYAQYLAWAGSGSAQQLSRVDFFVWNTAATYAYAVSVGQHVGNNLSPVYTPESGRDQGVTVINNVAASLKWTDSQRLDAIATFLENYNRLVTQWGVYGSKSGSYVPPAFDPNAYAAPTPTPTTPNAPPPPPPPRTIVQIVSSEESSYGGSPYAFATLAWRTIKQDSVTRAYIAGSASSWTTWKSGVLDKLSSENTSAVLLSAVRGEVELARLNGDSRAATYWDYDRLIAAVNGPGPGTPPPNVQNIDVVAAAAPTPNGGINTWTDATPPTPPPSTGIGPGSTKDTGSFSPPVSIKNPPLTTDLVMTEPSKPVEVQADAPKTSASSPYEPLLWIGIAIVAAMVIAKMKGG